MREVIHLDSAADARCSPATIAAVTEHLRREAEQGGYVAEAGAAEEIGVLRTRLAHLVGLDVDDVALTESASSGLDVLLTAWPLPRGATVAVAESEWGPNLDAFAARGLSTTPLPVDDHGLIDLDALERRLAEDPPDLVHVVQVSAHRGLVQPGAQVSTLCRAAGVPVWVDAAQALGHTDTDVAPDAVYGTSRKWLRGPRGVGIVAVATHAQSRLRTRSHGGMPDGTSPIRTWESAEAAIAARVGLAAAVEELWSVGFDRTEARLTEIGAHTREALGDISGWEVDLLPERHPRSGALTTVRPLNGQDVNAVRAELLAEHAILVTAVLPWRAPLEPPKPALRISPHVDVTDDDLIALAGALEVNKF